ncbi:MAG TPA: MerR family transcriptional regulator [Vicinamibacterales bacterium]|nr:MerR family transcriptional regulator [Vicinamibacterales bacterium]
MASPKRDVYKAAEVCEVVQLQPYVLRSWEAEFPQIGQAPAGGGPRVYRRADLELVLRIKQLVFEEGLTLSGARRRLEEESDRETAPPMLVEEVLGAGVRAKLKNVRSGLESILQMLSKDDAQAELHLVSPRAPVAAKKKPAAKAKAKK